MPFAMSACALVAVAAVALPADARQGTEQTVNVALSGFNAERIKKAPIAKRSGGKVRVAMSLPPSDVGQINDGDAVWAGSEIEISVTCLERIPQCVGRSYHYTPHVKARLVLAPSADAKSPRNTVPLGGKRMRCAQDLPNRNHHCVLAVEGARLVRENDALPCDRCYVNLLIDAFHRSARKGHVIVIGADGDRGIEQDKGMVHSAVFDPGPPPAVPPIVSNRPSAKRVAVGGSGNGPKKVIYSRRLNELRAGEQLIVTAKAVQKIGHLPYNVLMQSQLLLSEKSGSTGHIGVPIKVASLKGRISAQNGFNCTQGRSGHANPCVIRKVAAFKITRDARAKPERGEGPFVPLFVNLVVQNREIVAGGRSRHRAGDHTKIARKAGFIKVRRYGPEFR
jgi:hypothetical protein